jgi:hypothetical protein
MGYAGKLPIMVNAGKLPMVNYEFLLLPVVIIKIRFENLTRILHFSNLISKIPFFKKETF